MTGHSLKFASKVKDIFQLPKGPSAKQLFKEWCISTTSNSILAKAPSARWFFKEWCISTTSNAILAKAPSARWLFKEWGISTTRQLQQSSSPHRHTHTYMRARERGKAIPSCLFFLHTFETRRTDPQEVFSKLQCRAPDLLVNTEFCHFSQENK